MVDIKRPSSCRVGKALRLERVRAEIPQRSVSTPAIVQCLDVEVNAPLRLLPRVIAVTPESWRNGERGPLRRRWGQASSRSRPKESQQMK